MPEIRLSTPAVWATLPVRNSNGVRLSLPRAQFRCLVRLPNLTMPRDGIIDTGSPFKGASPARSNGRGHFRKCSRPSSELSISIPHSPASAPGMQHPWATFTAASTHATCASR